MNIQEIREQIAEELRRNIELWSEVLDNTSPGNYGLNDWDISVSASDIFVDIPKNSFNFNNVKFSAELILGGSKGDFSFTHKYQEIAKGIGIFKFADKNRVTVESINP
jgi:hypothetical protein